MRNPRVILCLPLILGGYALAADEAVDRTAIGRTIAALNQVPQPPGLFTDDAVSDLGKLPEMSPRMSPEMSSVQFQPNATVASAGGLAVVISHEPWGEAQIYPLGALTQLNPRITSGTVRFVTPDVAMVEGTYTRRNGDVVQTTPLLFLMKRDGDVWKIASLRLLASN